jgi:predicted nuclease of restriction endonuclease-like (RecB) superfamily
MKKKLATKGAINKLYQNISQHIDQARQSVQRAIDTEMVKAYWHIGREIVAEEQNGESKTQYGTYILQELSIKLMDKYGKGFSIALLKNIRQFYITYSDRNQINVYSPQTGIETAQIGSALETKTDVNAPQTGIETAQIGSALQAKTDINVFQVPFHSKLGWIHYRALMRITRPEARQFYEIEAIKNNWSGRELERQIASLLFDRLAKSKNKEGLLVLASMGQEILTPEDAIRDPIILEFLHLPESNVLVESKLEDALISNLQHFLLELGTGFAFIARQKRLTLDGDNYYADLVLYHVILKCYVIVDIKTRKLSHGDLGQMQLYANYFDQEIKMKDDNHTIGLVLCTEKSDSMVQYTLGKKNQQIFASKYHLHFPSIPDLEKEIKKLSKKFHLTQ